MAQKHVHGKFLKEWVESRVSVERNRGAYRDWTTHWRGGDAQAPRVAAPISAGTQEPSVAHLRYAAAAKT
jgi:hypothetical protein